MRLTSWLLLFAGLCAIAFPLLPGLREQGLVIPALGVIVAFLCLQVGAMVHEQRRLASRFRELLEGFDAFTSLLFGADFKVKREAIAYLISALDSANLELRGKAHEQLERLTGQRLDADADTWRTWWEANRATFVLPENAASEKGDARRFT